MRRGPALENLTRATEALCVAGLDPATLRDRVLTRLRRAVPFDAAFWSIADPATLLFTAPHQDGIPPHTVAPFLENEFLGDDVNRFVSLARDPSGVRTLAQATEGRLDASARHRDILRPLGLGDELRAALRARGACWGYLCLHREAGALFAPEEAEYVRRLAPHLAEGIRAGLLAAAVEAADPADSPGLVVLGGDGSFLSATDAGRVWLDELGHPEPERFGVPAELRMLAARLRAPGGPGAAQPRLRMQTHAGRWAVLHASHLATGGSDAVAVIIDEPSPSELAPVMMLAYGLTAQEQALTSLVCRGPSTREIGARLHISALTVQDHLKSIFDKTGVRSRRQLVATILHEQYLPRAMTGDRPAPSGFFAPPARDRPAISGRSAR
jgi:DNA-binding CsgD family transcriptional regulator